MVVGFVDFVFRDASDVELRFGVLGDRSETEAALEAVRESALECEGDPEWLGGIGLVLALSSTSV